jgi:DNA-directed RNA polymerase subunit H (RpoH/RPB5)
MNSEHNEDPTPSSHTETKEGVIPLNNPDSQMQYQQHEEQKQYVSDERHEERTSIQLNPSSGVSIRVSDPIVKGDKYTLGFVIYAIRGSDKDGAYETFRRYSEFNTVRTIMVTRWPGCYVPPLPPKKKVGNMDQKFIEERRRFLDHFCKLVAEIPYLYYSEEFQIFLRSTNPDIDKALSNLAKSTAEEIIAKYTITFSYLSGKELNNDTIKKIVEFNSFLKKAALTFKNFKQIAKTMALAKKSYYDQFILFHNMCMVEYEKTCVAEYSGNKESKYAFNSTNNLKLTQILMTMKQSFAQESLEKVYEFMKSESHEIDAFIESISMRDKYDQYRIKMQDRQKSETSELQKLIGGKTTFKTLFSGKSKEEDISNLEKQIVKTTKEVENLTMLHDMITLVIAYSEVDKFRATKIDKYFSILKICAEFEQINNKNIGEYWGIIFEATQLAEQSI